MFPHNRCCAVPGGAGVSSYILRSGGLSVTLSSRGNTALLTFRRKTDVFVFILRVTLHLARMACAAGGCLD